jgi:hypothetical protein
MLKAKRIVSYFQKLAANVDLDGTLDLSDVLELRVKLIRRDGLCDPEQSSFLNRLEMMVLKGCTKPDFEKLRDSLCDSEQLSLLDRLEAIVLKGCTKPEFEKLAGIIWTLPSSLPPKLLKDEKLLQRMMRGLADPE